MRLHDIASLSDLFPGQCRNSSLLTLGSHAQLGLCGSCCVYVSAAQTHYWCTKRQNTHTSSAYNHFVANLKISSPSLQCHYAHAHVSHTRIMQLNMHTVLPLYCSVQFLQRLLSQYFAQ